MNIATSLLADSLSEGEPGAPLNAEQEQKNAAPTYAPVVGVVAMMAVALPLVFALQSNPQAARSPSPGNGPASATAITWNFSFECAQQIARASGKTMMIVFTSDACLACQWMEKEVFGRAPIIAEAHFFVALKIDAEGQPQLAARYRVEKCPAIVWTDAAGSEKHRADGGLNGYELYQAMQLQH